MSYQKIEALLKKCTVRFGSNKHHYLGTGFFVFPNHVLTCRHVVERLSTIDLFWDGKDYSISADQITFPANASIDLALIRLPENLLLSKHPCVLLDEELKPRNLVFAIGHTKEFEEKDTLTAEFEGWVKETTIPFDCIKFKAGQFIPGFSGAALLNENTKGVCGLIIQTRNKSFDAGGYGIPIQAAYDCFPQLQQENELFHRNHWEWWDMMKLEQQHLITLLPGIDEERPIIGRETVLNEITELLQQSTTPLVIHGQSGEGKTIVAEMYFNKYKNLFENIGWFEYEGNLVRTIINNAPTETVEENLVQGSEVLKRAAYLIAKKEFLNRTGKKLLIFDGIRGEENIKDILSHQRLLIVPNSQIILTAHLPIEGFANYALPKLSNENVNELFKLLLENSSFLSLQSLLSKIENHPLSIRLLALNTPADNWKTGSDFLKNLITDIEQFSNEDLSIDEFVKVLFTHSNLSFAEKWLLLQFSALPDKGFDMDEIGELIMPTYEVEEDGEMVVEYMPELENAKGYCNYIDDLLEKTNDEGDLEKVADQLVNKGWLDKKEYAYFLPELVAKVLMLKKYPHHYFVELIETLHINYFLKEDGEEYGPVKGNALYISHLEHLISVLEYSDSRLLLHKKLIKVYEDLLDFSNQLKEQEKYTFLVEKHEINSQERIWSACYDLSRCYRERGKYPEALEYSKKQVKIAETIFHRKHPSLATSYGNIGNTYDALGDYGKALEYQQKGMAILEEILDPQHPDLATSYNNIALTYQALGDYGKALEYQQKDMAIIEEILDPQHPDLATSYNNIALTYQALGDYGKALAYHQKSIAIREEILDPQHPDLATSYGNIGNTYDALGDYGKALAYHQKSIAIREEILDPQHPDLATSYGNIGNTYDALGDYGKALAYHQKSMAIIEEILDPQHPDLATSYNNIALTYQALGDYGKALAYHQKSIAIREEILDPQHPDLATSYGNIGNTYKALGDYGKALAYHQKSIAIREEILDPQHPDLATSYGNIGNTYDAIGDYGKALEYHQKDMAILEEILDPQHPDLATSYNNIALTYQALGDYGKALAYHQKSIAILEEILDPQHPDLATSYGNIGNTYKALGDYGKALAYHQKSIAIREEILDPQHPKLATSYHHIIKTYEKLEDVEKVEFYKNKIQEISNHSKT